MRSFLRLLAAESRKLHRSAALRVAWLFPLLYLAVEFLIFERPALGMRSMTSQFAGVFDTGQTKMVGALWAGFFQPLLVALLPALLFRPEHRFKTWGHLHAMPVPRRSLFLSKAVVAMLLSAGSLLLIALGHWVERSLVAGFNPLLDFPFHGAALAKMLGWLWLGSLPILFFYLWASDRINSLAISVVFGLVGLLLTISLSGADIPQSQAWRRDLVPWVLPYVCAHQSLDTGAQEFHAAGTAFRLDDSHPPDDFYIQLPSGRRVHVYGGPSWDVVFPPSRPTPAGLLAAFSLGAAALMLGLGALDARRNRF